MSERRALLVAAGLALAATGCTTVDRAVGSVPWFTTMRDQVAVRPFENADSSLRAPKFLPPEGSIPTTGHEDSLDIFGAGLAAVNAMRNPVPATAASLARGRRIYDTYCAVCHGAQGAGDGTVAGRLGYVPAINTPVSVGMQIRLSDGYLYAVLRHGRGLMPRYGDRILDPRDRWNVVNYVRSLQGEPAR